MKININELKNIANLTFKIDPTKDLILSTSEDGQTLDISIHLKELCMVMPIIQDEIMDEPYGNGLITEKTDYIYGKG